MSPSRTHVPAVASLPGDAELLRALALAGRLLRARADADLAPAGLTAQGLALLRRLAEEDDLTQTELARRLVVEPPTVCRMIDRLERDGLLRRRADPGDRRATRVRLTQEGRSAARLGRRVVEEVAHRAFAGLDDEERAVLWDLLGRVLARALAAAHPSPEVPA